ncbi:MAG: SDR family oxidoreductase [Actinomycetota bacterium]
MTPQDTVAFVTGASRGLGRHLVDALLARGARRAYATARDVSAITAHERVVPVRLDLTDSRSIADAAARAGDVTLLINNAGTAAFAMPLEADPQGVAREMSVNYAGTYAVIRAFVPVLERNGGGTIVNVLSLLSLASLPMMAGYSASKAAAHSLTQALRPVLAPRGIAVHGAYPAGIDTDMLAGLDLPKTAPRHVAEAILDGVAAGHEDVFPDPNSQQAAEVWLSDPKGLERQLAGG